MKKLLITVFALFPCLAFSQAAFEKANAYYERLAYSKASVKYEKALKQNPLLNEAKIKLADCYRLTNQTADAEYWYSQVVKLPECRAEHRLYYAQALMSNGKYAEAREWMYKFQTEIPEDDRGNEFVNSIDRLHKFFEDSSRYHILKLAVNTPYSDFGPALFDKGIVFTSSRPQSELVSTSHSWTGKPFLSMYYAQGKTPNFKEPVLFSKELETKMNDGPVCFGKAGTEIYITRNNALDETKKKTRDNTSRLKIFISGFTDGKWSEPEEFPFNSNKYNCAHPSLSADNSTLYFSSDMPGGYGGMDLYSCTREGSNWSEPKNLGVLINSKGNEVFPYIHADNTLFFASNGHEGLGGLDIFYSKKKETGFSDVHNAGYPINTADDDFSLIYDNKNKAGYFSSNREHRDGDDDIYVYTRDLRITGIVVEKETGVPVADALVELTTAEGIPASAITTSNGKFEFTAEFNKQYFIKGSKEHMGEVSDSLSTSSLSPADDPFVRIELSSPTVSTLTIKVTDKETRLPIYQASLKTEKTKSLVGKTSSEGFYKQIMPSDSTMKLIVSKPGYASKLVMVSTKGLQRAKNFVYNVTLKRTEGIEGYEDWYKLIYYDLDKSTIRADAKKTLDEVIVFLETNPNIIIGLSAHTDSRASREYNIGLSQRRAQAVKDYLLMQGVEPGHIARMEWDGESLLVNRCDDGTPCSEDDHQLNRRCEIRVTGILKHSLSKK